MQKHSKPLTQKQKIILYACAAFGAIVAAVVAVLILVRTVKNPPEVIFSSDKNTNISSSHSQSYSENTNLENTTGKNLQINGITNGSIYYTTQYVTILSDTVCEVSLNGEPCDLQFYIDGNQTNMYVIDVTDNTGHTESYIVYTKPLKTLLDPILSLSTNTVTSNDADSIKSVKEKALGLNVKYCTTAEVTELENIVLLCDDMLNKIDSVSQSIKNIIEDFSNYENSAQAVTNNIHTIINNIDALTSTDNLTPKERSQLQTIRIKCQNLLLNENIPE